MEIPRAAVVAQERAEICCEHWCLRWSLTSKTSAGGMGGLKWDWELWAQTAPVDVAKAGIQTSCEGTPKEDLSQKYNQICSCCGFQCGASRAAKEKICFRMAPKSSQADVSSERNTAANWDQGRAGLGEISV